MGTSPTAHLTGAFRLGKLVVSHLLPEAPRLFPTFGDFSRKTRITASSTQESLFALLIL